MERIDRVNPDRIEWCCRDLGVEPEEVASAIGVAPGAWREVLRGTRGLTFNQLRRLAAFSNRGVLFFLELGPVNVEQLRTPPFRTIANQKPELSAKIKALIERVERQREVYLQLREDLGDPAPPFMAPDLPPEPQRAGEAARAWLGLGAANDFHSYRAAVEARGLLVFRSNGYAGDWQIPKESAISGFAIYDPRCPVIVVKKQDAESRQAFTLMHELAHVLLHKASFIDDEVDLYGNRPSERDANAFAGALLVTEAMADRVGPPPPVESVSELAEWLRPYCNEWGVSAEVILRRLLDRGWLEPAVYDSYREWASRRPPRTNEGGSRKWRHREPNHIFGDRFVRTVLDALSARHISLYRASTYLDNIKVRDVHELEGFHARV